METERETERERDRERERERERGREGGEREGGKDGVGGEGRASTNLMVYVFRNWTINSIRPEMTMQNSKGKVGVGWVRPVVITD